MKPADREATARELVELLDRIDEAEEAIRKATKEAKERVGGLRDKARELRDLLAGKKGAQLPLAAAVLEEAKEVKERKHVTVYRSRKKKAAKCAACGEPAVCWVLGEVRCAKCSDEAVKTWHAAHGTGPTTRALDEPDLKEWLCNGCGVPWDQPSPGCEECEHAKGATDGT